MTAESSNPNPGAHKAPLQKKHFILATAGHVDHGKSALVKALSGIDPDRLPEEKARGITIELGFAYLDLKSAVGEPVRVGIVDVPGHEDFVRNMISGVGAINLALLVVAADDGWMRQTEEHLQILTYLDVTRMIVTITKSDLADAEKTAREIREQLFGTAFADASIVPTSVKTGDGLNKLKQTIAAEIFSLDLARDIAKPRLFVDRAFSLRGFGTIVTGTLIGGKFYQGDRVIIHSKNLRARIRSIQNHGADYEEAQPGMRVALNLPELSCGKDVDVVSRGDVVTLPNFGEPMCTLDVLLERSPRLRPKTPAAKPLRDGASIKLHLGTSRIAARIFLLDQSELGAGETAIAQLRLSKAVHAFYGDRFVLRDASEQFTIGGGIILDPDSDEKKFRTEAQRTFLQARAASPNDLEVFLTSELQKNGVMKRDSLLTKSNFSAEEITKSLSEIKNAGRAIVRDSIAADAILWNSWRNEAVARIDAQHRDHPDEPGIEIARLRPKNISILAFDSLIEDLCADGFVRSGTIMARASHRITLPPGLQKSAEQLRKRLSANPFDPPARGELADTSASEQALRFLMTSGEVIELTNEIVLPAESFQQMRKAIVDFISAHGPATASELRQKLQTTRRILIPLLERLDREGLTWRDGDRRKLRQNNPEIKHDGDARR